MNGAFLPPQPDQGTIDQLQQMGGQMQAPAADPAQPAPQDPGAAPPQPPDHSGYAAIDLEGCISAAIEAGCHLAVSASDISAEDYERFSHGVNLLCLGLAKIQPATDPAAAGLAAAGISADQRHAAALMQAEHNLHQARAQGNAEQVAAATPPPEPSRPNGPAA